MLSPERRFIANFDWVLLILTLLMAGVGVVNLYSATSNSGVYLRQIYWLCIGGGAMVVIVAIPYQKLYSGAYLFYLLNVLALLAVLFIGKSAGGSQRWLALGPFTIQPSEVMKVTLIMAIARYCQQKDQEAPLNLKGLLVPLGLILIPAGLIMKQPDLGTALLLMAIGGCMLLFNGIRWQTLAILAMGLGAAMVPIWQHLKPYQRQRVLTFFDPGKDPLGSGYHIIQSKIAVGSGGIWGKGFMEGTQSQLRFIPEHHTDFAFSVLAEEWGFMGSAGVVVLFALLMIWAMNVAYYSRDKFARLLTFGVMTVFFWQLVVNVGMVTGMLPVVGIPLPFISYGGSSAVVVMAGLALIMNVSMRRYTFSR